MILERSVPTLTGRTPQQSEVTRGAAWPTRFPILSRRSRIQTRPQWRDARVAAYGQAWVREDPRPLSSRETRLQIGTRQRPRARELLQSRRLRQQDNRAVNCPTAQVRRQDACEEVVTGHNLVAFPQSACQPSFCSAAQQLGGALLGVIPEGRRDDVHDRPS